MSFIANLGINIDARSALQKLREVQRQSQQLDATLTSTTTAVARENRELQAAAGGMQRFVSATNQAKTESNQFITATNRTASAIKGQGEAASNAVDPMGRLAIAIGGVAAATAALQKSIKTAADFETSLSDIGKTANASNAKLANIAETLVKMSAPARTNLAPSVLAQGLQDLVARGLELDAAVASLEQLGKVAVATNSELTDVTKTGFQLQSALKIKPTELKETFDALAYAGKQGAFELKDMAQYMPTIASAATSLGITGKEGAVALAAMMQMVRKDAPGSAEAATRLTDALMKMTAPETVRNFKKFGVDIEAVLKNAVARGVNPMDEGIKKLIQVTGKDQFNLSRIFGDKEAKLAIQALMKYREEYEKLKKEAGGAAAAGTVQQDFNKSLATFNQQLGTLKTSGEVLALSLGSALLPILERLLKDIVPIVDGAAAMIRSFAALPGPVKSTTVELVRLVGQTLLLKKAIEGIIALRIALMGVFAGTATTATTAAAATGSLNMNMRYLQGSMVTATAKATPLLAALRSIAAMATIAVAVNVAIYGYQELQRTGQILDKLKGKTPGGIPASGIFPGETREGLAKRQALQAKQIPLLQEKIKRQEAIAAGMPAGMGVLANRELDILRGRLAGAQRTVMANPNNIPQSGKKPGKKPGNKPLPNETASPPGPQQSLSSLIDGSEITNKLQSLKTTREIYLQEKLNWALRQKNADQAMRMLTTANEYANTLDEIAATKELIDKLDSKAGSFIRSQKDKKGAAIQVANEMNQLRFDYSEKLKTLDAIFMKHAGVAIGVNVQEGEQNAKLIEQGATKIQQLMDERDLLQAKLVGNEAEVMLKQQLRDLTKEMTPEQALQAVEVSKGVEALKAQLVVADKMKATYEEIGSTIKGTVVGAIQGAIDGTKTLGDIADSILKNVTSRLIDAAVNMALFGEISGFGKGGGLLGFLNPKKTPARAMGGPVAAGQSYMVGERGPELFVPSTGGKIVPNGKGGGNVTVNVSVDATGSQVQGDNQQAAQLGRLVAAAVQSELVKAKRPGGILS